MTNQHNNRNRRHEGCLCKKTVQYAFSMFICIWFLYQIYSFYIGGEYGCNNIQDKFRNEQIGKLLGRKGGTSKSRHAEEVELYGVDLISEAERIRNVTDGDGEQSGETGIEGIGDGDKSDTSSLEDTGEQELSDIGEQELSDNEDNAIGWRLGEFATKQDDTPVNFVTVDERLNDQGNQSNKVEHTELKELTDPTADTEIKTSMTDGGEMLLSETESNEDQEVRRRQEPNIESNVKVSAVILKSGGTLGVFRFSDENGIPEHDSAPSRRINIQADSFLQEKNSSRGNQSTGVEEACGKLCLQEVPENQSLNKFEAANEVKPEMSAVISGEGSTREFL